MPSFLDRVGRLSLAGLLLVVSTAALATDVPFAPTSTISTGGASSVFAADVDGDGDLDALSTPFSGVAWHRNNGASPWTTHTIDPTIFGTTSVLASDVDGDGDLDVLASVWGACQVVWYQNNGASPWTEHTIDTDCTVVSVFAADVDGDGDVDALSASQGDDTIAWYENDGTPANGGWTRRTISTAADFALSVFAADMDGDGDVDALSASQDDDTIAWYENDGTPLNGGWTLHQISSIADQAQAVFAADMDSDGDVDVLSASLNNELIWHENPGASPVGWAPHAITSAVYPADSVFAADVDCDGDMDVLSAGSHLSGFQALSWFENDGTPAIGLWTAHTISLTALGASSVFAADVDDDGDVDVLSAQPDKVAWHENRTIHRSAELLPQSVISLAADGAQSVFAADMDNDGDVDVLSASYEDDTIAWYRNDGTPGGFGDWTERELSDFADGASSVFAADVDGDGDVDALSASYKDGKVAWYQNDGELGNWFERVISTFAGGPLSVVAADVNGDGHMDALCAGGNQVIWYENDGTPAIGLWTAHTISLTALGASSVFAADVDGDGDVDALSALIDVDTIAWYENDGASLPGWTERTISTSASDPFSVFAADVDDDGDVDVLSATFAGDVAWYENDGTPAIGPWTERTISAAVIGASSVFAADMDCDGDVDVLSASQNDDTIAWYENDGASLPGWTERTMSPAADGAQSVFAADVDGDCDLDALSASSEGDTIAWYENRGGQFSLATTATTPGGVANGQTYSLLTILATHRGRAGDTDIEIATLELLFETAPDDLMPTDVANTVIQSLHVYLDSGSGQFDGAPTDTLVTTVATLLLTDGVQTVSFTNGDPNVQITPGTPRRYFVVLDMAADASQYGVDKIYVTHLTESSSTALDRDNDIPLSLEFAPNTGTGPVEVGLPGPGGYCDAWQFLLAVVEGDVAGELYPVAVAVPAALCSGGPSPSNRLTGGEGSRRTTGSAADAATPPGAAIWRARPERD